MFSSKLKISVLALSTLFVSGCASTGQTTFGSMAIDQATIGALTGLIGGYAGARAVGADSNRAQDAALIAGMAGGFIGFQQGRAMDERLAAQRLNQMQAQQNQIANDLQLQSNIRFENMLVTPTPTPHRPQPQPQMRSVAKALELPIARYQVVASNGNLSRRAIQSLRYMDRTAKQSNADFIILIPSSDVGLAGAISGVAPTARLMESRDINQFILIIQPRI